MKTLLLLIGLLLVSFACKKKYTSADPTLTIGDYGQVTAKLINSSITGGFQQARKFFIDLDEDGLNDIEFYTELVGGVGSELNPIASIRTLHAGCQVLTYQTADTIFRLQGQQNSVTPSGDFASIFWKNLSCRRESAAAQIDSVYPRFKLQTRQFGENVGVNDEFRSGTFELLAANSSEFTHVEEPGGASYYELLNIQRDCPDFPQNTRCYLPVRIMTQHGIRLGWIILKHEGNYFYFFEYALQP